MRVRIHTSKEQAEKIANEIGELQALLKPLAKYEQLTALLGTYANQRPTSVRLLVEHGDNIVEVDF